VTAISSSQLRNSTAHLLERVEGGEELVITVDGRPVARLVPMGSRQWIPRAEFLHRVIGHQADAKLADDLRALAPDNTDGSERSGR
jgi:prevent-host-death family protein